MNLLSIYQITHSGSGKKVEFTPDLVIIYDSSNGSKIVVGEVNCYSRLYTFSHFTHKSDYVSLLTHANEQSSLWHERFGNMNFKYLDKLSKGGMVDALVHIEKIVTFYLRHYGQNWLYYRKIEEILNFFLHIAR
jgi:hypothetical protein